MTGSAVASSKIYNTYFERIYAECRTLQLDVLAQALVVGGVFLFVFVF